MLRSVILQFSRLRMTTVVTQVRGKGRLNRPKLRNPYWFLRKNRSIREDFITPENNSFVQEVIKDTYGPALAMIQGVGTSDQNENKLIKTIESEKHPWTPNSRRCGLIARKIGQYPLWLKNGYKLHTTLLQVVDNHVIKYIPPEQYKPMQKPTVVNMNKYGCLLVGAESADPTLFTKDYCGIFRNPGVMPKKNLARFLVSPTAAIPSGTELNVGHFKVGQFVDVRGKTVYRGFQGVVKRHGFKGMPASHGVTKTHRRPGNIGGGGEKGRVWPGKKMPGHMGNRWRILKGLRIWRINSKYNVMWVQGNNVPGSTNGLVYIYDTILPLRKPELTLPFPTHFEVENANTEYVEDDIWFENVHNFKDGTITYKQE